MPATIMKQSEQQNRSSWRDFTLEEHIRSYIGIPYGAVMKSTIILDINNVSKIYRINVWKDEIIVKSNMVKILETPEGYIFEDIK